MRPLLVIGTRPEAIKLAPVWAECCRRSGAIEPLVCLTGQHDELVRPVLEYFELQVGDRLDAMRPGQSLAALTARLLEGLDAVVAHRRPDCLVAQGDTTSVLAAGMVAFYRRLPFVHVEAGLRSGNLQSPWPEEFNRRIATLAATLHCAPTARAAENLISEGIDPATIHVTGNTVIDALLMTLDRERKRDDIWWQDRRLVLITSHRRENIGDGLAGICRAVNTLVSTFPDVAWVWPLHANPQVKQQVERALSPQPNLYLRPAADYPEFVWLMDRSTLILTDSGGVQEEAPSLGKPVLVLRDTTERPEAIECGAAELVGTDSATIVERTCQLLMDDVAYRNMQTAHNPYGDGRASRRIVDRLLGQPSDVPSRFSQSFLQLLHGPHPEHLGGRA